MKRIFMLAAHDPDIDPRINWEAGNSSSDCDITVMGLQNVNTRKPAVEMKENYKILRFNRGDIIGKFDFILIVMRHLFPLWLKIFCIIAGVILYPVCIVLEILYNFLRFVLPHKTIIAPLKCFIKYIFRGTAFINSMSKFKNFIWLTKHFYNTSLIFCRELQKMNLKPQVVHCNDLDTLMAGVLAKKMYQCGVVYDAHEFWPYADVEAPWYQVTLSKLYEKWLISRADYVITVNPLLAQSMEKTYGLSKVFSLPNCEPWNNHTPHLYNKKEESKTDDKVKFLYQGNFAPKRGLEEILHAWVHINSSKAVLFMRGPYNIYKEQCIKIAEKTGQLGESIFFLDPVLENELVSAASEADVGIIPYKPVCINYKFCCPNKLSQYMHAGLTILSNELPFVKSVIEKYACGLTYNSNDEKSIVNTFNYIIENPEFRKTCSQNALSSSEKEYNWQVQGKILMDIYHNLCQPV